MSIPHSLLALLTPEPKFGLQLKEEFEARTGSVWPLNVGQVYTTLGRLERDGLVAVEEGTTPARKLYGLTKAGRTELMTWLATPPDDSSPPRNELVIKIMVALSVPGADVTEIIQNHRLHVLGSMQQLTKLKREDDDLALLLVVDAELFRLEAMVRWLDTCDSRLNRGARLAPLASTSSAPQPVTDTAAIRDRS